MKFKELPPIESGANLPRLKLADGQSIKGVFRGEPHDFQKHWVNGRTAVCPGRDNCEFCKSADKNIRRISFRFSINFVTREEGKFVAKVFEAGRPTYTDLAELVAKYDLKTYIMTIKRQGKGPDTRYSIIPEPDGKLAGPRLAAIESVPLNDLTVREAPTQAPAAPVVEDDGWANDAKEMDVPF